MGLFSRLGFYIKLGNPARVVCTLGEYIDRYRSKMLPLKSTDDKRFRKELTTLLWGKER